MKLGDDFLYKLQINNISANYQSVKCETKALSNINFSLKEGDFVSIVGPSGCGKSTLLNIIAGLLKASSGEVLIDGKVNSKISSKIGYMFQNDNLFDWLSVYDNIALGLKIRKKLDENASKYIDFLLKEYSLYDFKNHHPKELSGGMRQRVALIRTLVLNPEILLLDEPFSALDYQTRLNVNDDIYKIIKKENKTALMVTHDISEAIAMSERVIVLSKRPAKVKFDMNLSFPDDCHTPLKRRDNENFRYYFNTIWKELDIDDKPIK